MPTRMRWCGGSVHIAWLKGEGQGFNERDGLSREEWDAIPAPQPGDTWRIRWHGGGDGSVQGPVAGYAICCPQCRKVHFWTTALNCKPCPHQGISSCWRWSGSAEENLLSAAPSLHAVKACGWHGFLTNGVLTP